MQWIPIFLPGGHTSIWKQQIELHKRTGADKVLYKLKHKVWELDLSRDVKHLQNHVPCEEIANSINNYIS